MRSNGAKNRLHLVYFGLAAFDILTISCTLFLSHQIMSIHERGVMASRSWAERLGHITELGSLAQQTNAPGNDVFDSHDAPLERGRRDEALAAFEAQRVKLIDELEATVSEEERAPIVAALGATHVAMGDMIDEADAIFQEIQRGRPDLAGRRMATMDRIYGVLTRSIATAVNEVQAIQLRHLEAQVATAQRFRSLEFIIGAIIVMIVLCVAIYGHVIGRVMRRNEEALHELTGALQRERDQLEERVAERTAELAEASALAAAASLAKSQFLANMSHELRTPLNAVVGYTEMMRESAVDEGRDADVSDHDRVLAASRRLQTLINQVLDLSKIEAGRIVVEAESFSVANLVYDAAAITQPMAEANANTLRLDLSADLGEAVSDAFKLSQCLLNLVSNAAKFTKGGEITVSGRRFAGERGDEIEFAVRDTGVGIADDQIDLLFQPFVQADASITRLYGGTGLGLAITREFARLLGGDVTVESAVGVGSTFRLRIPAVYVEMSRETRASEAQGVAPNRPTILVIDDDADMLHVAARRLSPLGFATVTARNAEAGLDLARTCKPCLVVLDIFLPDRSGWEILGELKEITGAPVLVASASDDRARAFAAGASDHLTKPIATDVFVAAALRLSRPVAVEAEATTENDSARDVA